MTLPASNKTWDVIVIGAGMGGGTVARHLAEAGRSVLILEQGPNGPRAEQHGLNPEMWDETARYVRGYVTKPVAARIDGRDTEFHAPLGAGVGGSSVFYAATLERPERHDFEPTPDMPHPTGGWPVTYDDMAPYFERAEAMFHVTGGVDPLMQQSQISPQSLMPPMPLTSAEQALADTMKRQGLHPYQAHLAMRNVPGCLGCLGRKCPKYCKMDGRSAGVEPALATGHATLISGARVEQLNGGGDHLSHVTATVDGVRHAFRARAIVLAAGALASPGLMLRSRSETWPNGVANSSDLVGRNLMFHLTEMLAIWPPGGGDGGTSKGLALRDFYQIDGQRMGLLQSMGIAAGYGEIVHFLNGAFDRSALRQLRPLRHLTRIPAALAARLFGSAMIFAGILEDLPNGNNRVVLDDDPEVLRFIYDIPQELKARRSLFRRTVRRALRGTKRVFLNPQPEPNFGHPCGTLRFGCDPKTSVVRPDGRCHDVRNLYVADASLFPTSMGTNPSLTIAALALRTGETVLRDLTTGDHT